LLPKLRIISNSQQIYLYHSQGISELTPAIRRWIYLGTVFAPTAIPICAYTMILSGTFILIFIFVRAYQNFVFTSDPTQEILEMGRRSLRRGSSILISSQHKILHPRDSYHLLKTPNLEQLSQELDSPT
jgi:scavenger receptor class B, member 1